MAVWMVRAGTEGQFEEDALQMGLALIGWRVIGDLALLPDEAALDQMLAGAYPGKTPAGIRNWRSQLWAFSKKIEIGDIIVLPQKTTHEIALGRVTGDYKYEPTFHEDMRHTRPVEWLVTDLSRDKFEQDLLYTLGAFMTVCRVERNNAEARIKAILDGRADTGSGTEPEVPIADLAEAAYDRIVRRISAEFPGAEMEKLVQGVLKAMGYLTMRKEDGIKDKGVDVLAAMGELGFGEPRICVQVKHTSERVDQMTVQQLIGAMDDFRAERGLFVSWSGFKSTVLDMERNQFFKIRLWSQKVLVDKILQHYEELPEEIRERLKLRRIWALEQEAEEELVTST